MKLAIIDTAADTVDVVNSAPDISANELTASAVNAEDATFTNSVTDPDGNTITGPLAQLTDEEVQDIIGNALGAGLTYDDGGNIIKETTDGIDREDITQDFTEPDVTVTNTDVEIRNGSIQLIAPTFWVDDFEDGVDSNWTGNTGQLTAQTTTVLAGSQSGQLDSSNSISRVQYPLSTARTGTIKLSVQISDVGTDSTDEVSAPKLYSNGSGLCRVGFNDGGNDILVRDSGNNSVANLGSWTTGTTYEVEISPDFANNEFDVILDGTTNGPYQFGTSADSYDEVEVWTDTRADSYSRSVYFDEENISDKSSGNALIEWDKGVPTDIYGWDVATFTKSPDGETVTVDVEDGNGNVLLSDISRNTDISSVATSKNVKLRVSLSRNDTSNNPTLDSAYRSWLV
jgi:hypothetical protein